MTYPDEILSAFLDDELPEETMQAIRDALAVDAHLADRLADLALVDQRVRDQATTIDRIPIPAATLAMFDQTPAEAKSAAGSRVITFPRWRRVPASLQRHAAAVAAISLLAGFVLGRLLPGTDDVDWAATASVLESRPSGTVYEAGAARLEPKLSFLNHQGDYCRQFQRFDQTSGFEAIACRQGGQWTLQAMLPVASGAPDSYMPASGGSALDDMIDQMMSTQPIDPSHERELIREGWTRAEPRL